MNLEKILTRALFGAAGGVAGLVAMRLAMKASSQIIERVASPPARAGGNSEAAVTAKIGATIYRILAGHPPSEATTDKLSSAVHWSFGVAMAAGYGIVRQPQRGLDPTGGLAFGTFLWLVGDELAVPILGLAKAPWKYPLRAHVTPLFGHLAYGLATAAATQSLARLAPSCER